MKALLPLSIAVALLLQPTQQANKAQALNLANTKDDCYAFQRLTACTNCGSLPNGVGTQYPYSTGMTYIDYETVTCSFSGICPDNVQRSTCSWKRYMYFECGTTAPIIVTVMTNSLPNHCYYTDVAAPIGSTTTVNSYQFKSTWNLPVTDAAQFTTDVTNGNILSSAYEQTILDNQVSVDEMLCDYTWAKHQNVDSNIQLTVGISPSGYFSATGFEWNIAATGM